MTEPHSPALASAFRADSGRVLAALIGQFRDFDLAEDALAEALSRAAAAWGDTPPDAPGAWLLAVARRVALDRLRKAGRHARPDLQAAVADAFWPDDGRVAPEELPDEIPDDRLRLMFTCCHPALAQEAQVALTLRTLGGLSVAEIARAFLVSPTAIARRLTRAKTKIRDAGIPYEVPEGGELARRLPQVLAVVYLIYNESYSATEGENLSRADLAREALRLSRLLTRLLPLPECLGLRALIQLHEARATARTGPDGGFIPLAEQDRSVWDTALIEDGRKTLLRALAQRRPGPYQIQAAISAVHNDAPSWGATDWPQIAGLYRALEAMTPGPVVSLNRAVALVECGQLDEAARIIDDLQDPLGDYPPFFSARAELSARREDIPQARRDLETAMELTRNAADRAYLARRHAAL